LEVVEGEARIGRVGRVTGRFRKRAAGDPKFRKELLREGIECLLKGDMAG